MMPEIFMMKYFKDLKCLTKVGIHVPYSYARFTNYSVVRGIVVKIVDYSPSITNMVASLTKT